jgi:hypothetical protein
MFGGGYSNLILFLLVHPLFNSPDHIIVGLTSRFSTCGVFAWATTNFFQRLLIVEFPLIPDRFYSIFFMSTRLRSLAYTLRPTKPLAISILASSYLYHFVLLRFEIKLNSSNWQKLEIWTSDSINRCLYNQERRPYVKFDS